MLSSACGFITVTIPIVYQFFSIIRFSCHILVANAFASSHHQYPGCHNVFLVVAASHIHGSDYYWCQITVIVFHVTWETFLWHWCIFHLYVVMLYAMIACRLAINILQFSQLQLRRSYYSFLNVNSIPYFSFSRYMISVGRAWKLSIDWSELVRYLYHNNRNWSCQQTFRDRMCEISFAENESANHDKEVTM
jgi:hypothetical protein